MRKRSPHEIIPDIAPELPDTAEEWDAEAPPPDHEDFMAVQANGLRAIGRRWEMRRRLKQESLARGEE